MISIMSAIYAVLSSITEYICYDDACHLMKFARNPVRADVTPQCKQLASVQMAVDKMHMRGHTMNTFYRTVTVEYIV
jgi:uncharacterized protein (DUF2342 family)